MKATKPKFLTIFKKNLYHHIEKKKWITKILTEVLVEVIWRFWRSKCLVIFEFAKESRIPTSKPIFFVELRLLVFKTAAIRVTESKRHCAGLYCEELLPQGL